MLPPRSLLFVSTPVGPLGSGLGGGVELTLRNLALAFRERGHRLRVLAPQGSQLAGFDLETVAGELQVPMQSAGRQEPVSFDADSVLVNLWERARVLQGDFDVILNFAYDWLPFYLTPFFQTPVAHLVSMASLTEAMDTVIRRVYQQNPQALAFHSQAQAQTFGLDGARCIGNALDLTLYQYSPQPENAVAWVGRISPEKALEDALAACQTLNLPLRIYGKIQDPDYWRRLQSEFAGADWVYGGFLPTAELQAELGRCRALLVTPRWLEAFGNVAMEALACGTPVVAYRRGGPAEIVRDGETGFLAEPDSVEALTTALGRIDRLERRACRNQAEREFSLAALGERAEAWLAALG
ncbi:MAG: glycosyltransferase [Cyanobacteria bacterium RI_101]|nr:glycosyltransferase [Cyanobacteria bacterium RI_101]